jgi:hypothetical protein
VLTVTTSGLAYVVAVWCIYQLGRPLRLPLSLRLILTASFALATVALPYTRHVNNHILLLGVAAALMLGLANWQLAIGNLQLAIPRSYPVPLFRQAGLGTLAGLGYTIDLGAGPVLLVCTLALVIYHCRRVGPVAVFALAALPWLVLHHAVNYAVGGTFKPANTVPEYFDWPGCTFNAQNLTGGWQHNSIGHFLKYAAALLVGKRGFLGHNLALFLMLPGFMVLLWRRTPELPEVLFAGCGCGGTWLVYALNSNNYSGLCCSIRWFVPLLAPGYYVLAVFLRQYPRYRGDFLLLSGWGAVMAGLMWGHGPWLKHMMPFFWPLQGTALLSWLAYRTWQRRREQGQPLAAAAPEHPAKAA